MLGVVVPKSSLIPPVGAPVPAKPVMAISAALGAVGGAASPASPASPASAVPASVGAGMVQTVYMHDAPAAVVVQVEVGVPVVSVIMKPALADLMMTAAAAVS